MNVLETITIDMSMQSGSQGIILSNLGQIQVGKLQELYNCQEQQVDISRLKAYRAKWIAHR